MMNIHRGLRPEHHGGDGEALVFGDSHGRFGPQYKRARSAARGSFCRAVLSAYRLDAQSSTAVLFPSGMAAIGAVFSSLLRTPGGVVVYGDELYCDVKRTVDYLCGSGRSIQSFAVDIRDNARLLSLFREHGSSIATFHFEACTNPSGQMLDFEILPELRALAPNCTFVCDNTWLTATLFNPLKHGADIIVESCTKYVSGGVCIGGFVCGSAQNMSPVEEWSRVFGQFVPDPIADLFTEKIGSMPERVRVASRNAEIVARAMEEDDRLRKHVDKVMYPGLESHPTHGLAKRYLGAGYPACIWFHLPKSKKIVHKRLTSGLEIEFKTSFGGQSSRYDPWPVGGRAEKYDVRPAACSSREAVGRKTVSGTWIRLSIGYDEDVDQVIRHLCDDIASLME